MKLQISKMYLKKEKEEIGNIVLIFYRSQIIYINNLLLFDFINNYTHLYARALKKFQERYFDRYIVGWFTVRIKKTVLEYVIRNRQK